MPSSFIFDVDGTLTPSRGKINKHFAAWMEHFATHNACYWVTGSDQPKTEEQLGKSIYALAIRAYQCSGNDVYVGSQNILRNDVKWHPHTTGFFANELNNSTYPHRAGVHAENRPGLINFSVVGRRATKEQREDYMKWDRAMNERVAIAERFNKQFPQYQASVAGDTGIDITERGKTKAQIVPDFENNNIHFFGDATFEGGNDYEIALAIEEKGGMVHKVKSWVDTWDILKEITEMSCQRG